MKTFGSCHLIVNDRRHLCDLTDADYWGEGRHFYSTFKIDSIQHLLTFLTFLLAFIIRLGNESLLPIDCVSIEELLLHHSNHERRTNTSHSFTYIKNTLKHI